MAAIEITKTGNKIRFILNAESNKHGYKKVTKNIDTIVDVCLEKGETFVLMSFANGSDMMLTTVAGTLYLEVDTVAAAAASDNPDLYTKLDALLP